MPFTGGEGPAQVLFLRRLLTLLSRFTQMIQALFQLRHMLFFSDVLKQYTIIRLTIITIALGASMGTLSATTRNNRFAKTTATRVTARGLEKKTFIFGKRTRLFLLSLVYILNGNHDPKKVQKLNLVLVSLFLTVGFFLNQDMLLFGFAFSGIALVNGINVWIVQNLSGDVWNPVERKISAQVHDSLQKHVGR